MNRNHLIIAALSALLSFSCNGGGGGETASTYYCTLHNASGDALTELNVPSAGGSFEVSVKASGMWTVSSDADWVVPSPSRGNLHGTTTLSVYRNSTKSARTATVKVTCSGVEPAVLTLSQEAGGSGTDVSTLRFMTFNIRTGGKSDGSTDVEGHEWTKVRKPAVLAMFNELSPDIAVLQECRQEQLNDLEASLGDYLYGRYACDSVLRSGSGIATTCMSNVFKNSGARSVIMFKKALFDMREWGVFWLSETPENGPATGFGTGVKKACLWMKLFDKSSSKEIYVVNIHYVTPGKGDVLLKCAQTNVDMIKKIIGDSTVSGQGTTEKTLFLAGDFNANDADSRIAPVLEYLPYARLDARVTDPSLTYNGFNTDSSAWKRLDHIFYFNATPETYKVVNEDKYGTAFISDHFPVYCDFVLK